MKQLFPEGASRTLQLRAGAVAAALLLAHRRYANGIRSGEDAQAFKYLKFFRLLAKTVCEDSKGTEGSEVEPPKLSLTIDGPASIFESSNKCGLQLASFLPALIQATEWSIDCEVKLRDRKLRLRLDQSSGLVSHYSNFRPTSA